MSEKIYVYKKWACRECNVRFRDESKVTIYENGDPTSKWSPSKFLEKIIKTWKDEILIHQCSPRIAGVADFAGVEFSEE